MISDTAQFYTLTPSSIEVQRTYLEQTYYDANVEPPPCSSSMPPGHSHLLAGGNVASAEPRDSSLMLVAGYRNPSIDLELIIDSFCTLTN